MLESYFLLLLVVAVYGTKGCSIPSKVDYGKNCPDISKGGCINGNIGYTSLAVAWEKCAKVQECGFVMRYHNGKFYLRRSSDPNTRQGRVWGYFNKCAKTAGQPVSGCVPKTSDASYGKNCPSSGCLNYNIGYKTLAEAWTQCGKVSGCGFVMRYHNNMYYLRRSSDPNTKQGGVWGYNYKPCASQCTVPTKADVNYGRGCGRGCLNKNIGYASLADAWTQCGKVMECKFILRWYNNKYYLRRANDPIVKHSGAWGYNYNCDTIDDLVSKWAPQVRLHPKEEWNPSGVDFFLRYVNLKGGGKSRSSLTPSNLPACNGNCYLETKQGLGCASCTNPPFLKGQDPKNAPVYAMVNEHSGDIMDITYWFFFPYNRGKRVCIGYFADNKCPCPEVFGHCTCPRINGCIGGYSTFGHHVADWEHVTVRLKKKQIYSVFLSIHDSAITNQYGGEFVYSNGVFRKGSKSLEMVGTHPVVYAAQGSHGIWPDGGRHVYKKLPNGDTLVDYTGGGGIAWNTWTNMKIVKYQKNRQYDGEFQFLEFQGRWGNRKDRCGIAEKVSGECILVNGPGGPHRGFMGEGKLAK